MNDGGVTRRGIILFALLGVTWGIPYLLIKIAVRQLDPAMLVLARTGLAAAVLLPLAAVRGEIMPVLRRWRPLIGFTLAEIAVVLGEPVTDWSVIGFAFILAGCYLVAVRRPVRIRVRPGSTARPLRHVARADSRP